MTSLLFRNLFFTILQPGLVAGLFPFLITRSQHQTLLSHALSWLQYTLIFIFLTGFIVTIVCILRFAFEGKGTLSPADETKQLVIGGLYKYSRNPMYIGVMFMLIAETLFTQSNEMIIYSLIVFTCFQLFIMFHEEPRLQRDFGDQYTQYRKQVRRWL
jgi:protein-S-isoprenylcysteine O-methyltransferase Ste14